MLGICDIKGMSGCTEEEIDAIVMHEHVPDAVASEMAFYLINCVGGVPRFCKIIVEDIEMAESHGDMEQAKKLKEVYKHFVTSHRDYNQSKLVGITH